MIDLRMPWLVVNQTRPTCDSAVPMLFLALDFQISGIPVQLGASLIMWLLGCFGSTFLVGAAARNEALDATRFACERLSVMRGSRRSLLPPGIAASPRESQ